MKTILSVLVLFVLFACSSSCSNKMQNQRKLCTAGAAGDTIIYETNQPVDLFTSCGKSLSSTLTGIIDSRCPKGVTCIWAGTVNVVLQLNNEASLNLAINKQKDTVYHNRNYSFTLVDVVPYPGTSSDAPKVIVRVVEN